MRILSRFYINTGIIFTAALATAVSFADTARAVDCTNCTKVFSELKKNITDLSGAQKLLELNKAELEKISPTDTSKRVKLGSNMFILKAKLETLENNRAVMEKTASADCKTCPMPKDEEAKVSDIQGTKDGKH